jgi:hypothetical protein
MFENQKENTMSLFKFSLRTNILIGVCLQNAGYTLFRKYSTQTENVSSKEILLMAGLNNNIKFYNIQFYDFLNLILLILLLLEFIKFGVATWLTVNSTELSDSQGVGMDKLKWLVTNSGKMLVLAAIYGAMNILR